MPRCPPPSRFAQTSLCSCKINLKPDSDLAASSAVASCRESLPFAFGDGAGLRDALGAACAQEAPAQRHRLISSSPAWTWRRAGRNRQPILRRLPTTFCSGASERFISTAQSKRAQGKWLICEVDVCASVLPNLLGSGPEWAPCVLDIGPHREAVRVGSTARRA